jgi:hypothetical protein
MPADYLDDLPETVRTAFAERTLLGAPEVARLLEIDPKTLRRHIANGDISFRVKGFGRVKPRRVFTITDIAKFLQPQLPISPQQMKMLSSPRSVHGPTLNMTFRRRKTPRKPTRADGSD